MANYPCKTFSPRTYLLARVHPLQMDRWTDGQTDGRQPCQYLDRSAYGQRNRMVVWSEASFRGRLKRSTDPHPRVYDFSFFPCKSYLWNSVNAAKTIRYADRDRITETPTIYWNNATEYGRLKVLIEIYLCFAVENWNVAPAPLNRFSYFFQIFVIGFSSIFLQHSSHRNSSLSVTTLYVGR